MITYCLKRSNRRTIGMELTPQGEIIVRAPMRLRKSEIDRFVLEHEEWIERARVRVEKKRAEREKRLADIEMLTEEELDALYDEALRVIPERVRHFAPIVGVNYHGITIRCQKTRWGSCSSKGNLNFNCLLMLTPPEVIDSVVVHELCHRLEMNHSERFYREVYRVCPEYDKRHAWLKKNGAAIMARVER